MKTKIIIFDKLLDCLLLQGHQVKIFGLFYHRHMSRSSDYFIFDFMDSITKENKSGQRADAVIITVDYIICIPQLHMIVMIVLSIV